MLGNKIMALRDTFLLITLIPKRCFKSIQRNELYNICVTHRFLVLYFFSRVSSHLSEFFKASFTVSTARHASLNFSAPQSWSSYGLRAHILGYNHSSILHTISRQMTLDSDLKSLSRCNLHFSFSAKFPIYMYTVECTLSPPLPQCLSLVCSLISISDNVIHPTLQLKFWTSILFLLFLYPHFSHLIKFPSATNRCSLLLSLFSMPTSF